VQCRDSGAPDHKSRNRQDPCPTHYGQACSQRPHTGGREGSQVRIGLINNPSSRFDLAVGQFFFQSSNSFVADLGIAEVEASQTDQGFQMLQSGVADFCRSQRQIVELDQVLEESQTVIPNRRIVQLQCLQFSQRLKVSKRIVVDEGMAQVQTA